MFGVQAEQSHLCRQSPDSSFLHEAVKICDWADEDDCKITSFQYSRTLRQSFWNVKVWVYYKIRAISEGLVSIAKFDQHYEKNWTTLFWNSWRFCTKQSTTVLLGVTVSNWHHNEHSGVLGCVVSSKLFFFFSLNENNDLFLLLKEIMVLEQSTPVFMFVFFTVFFFFNSLSLYLNLAVQKAFINNCTAFFSLYFDSWRTWSFHCTCTIWPAGGNIEANTIY